MPVRLLAKTCARSASSKETLLLDTRMIAQQQIRLLGGMVRLLSRLLHRLLWQEMSPKERKRMLAWLNRLQQDLQETRLGTMTEGSQVPSSDRENKAKDRSLP